MIRMFCGYEQREALGFHVFAASVIAHASNLVSIVPLAEMGLPRGSNAFTRSRFLVPHLSDYVGRAIFADASDMLMAADVAELDALFDPRYAVQVVKHPNYQTRHPVKYRGTPLETVNMNYPRKNWASLMLVNCEHQAWRRMSPAGLAEFSTIPTALLGFEWLPDGAIGELPNEWNRLVDEGQPVEGAKLLHWTAGIPGFEEYRDAPGAEAWHATRRGVL